MTTLQWVLGVLSVLVALQLLRLVVRDRPVDDPALYALGLLELGLVVQLGWGLVRLGGPHEGLSVVTYVCYLVGSLLVLPIAFVWAISERSRSGTAVLVVGVLLLPVLFLRLHDIWGAVHG